MLWHVSFQAKSTAVILTHHSHPTAVYWQGPCICLRCVQQRLLYTWCVLFDGTADPRYFQGFREKTTECEHVSECAVTVMLCISCALMFQCMSRKFYFKLWR